MIEIFLEILIRIIDEIYSLTMGILK